MRKTLTVRYLDAVKPAPVGKLEEIYDAVVPQMLLRVSDKGRRTFYLVARFGGPKSSPARRAIGAYPATSLDQARGQAREWLELLGKGIDPARKADDKAQTNRRVEERQNARGFEANVYRFIKARKRDGVRKALVDERDFNRVFIPAWGNRPIEEISMSEILGVLEKVAERGATRQALNLGQKIGTFFNWAVDQELITVSPYRSKRVAHAIGKKASRERVLTDDELRAFWSATAHLPQVYQATYRLLLLTGQRLNDIGAAKWSEINFEAKTLTVPAARFKSQRDHIIPLTDDAMEIIAAMPRFEAGEFISTLNGHGQITLGSVVKRKLDALMLVRAAEADGRRQRGYRAMGKSRSAQDSAHPAFRSGRVR